MAVYVHVTAKKTRGDHGPDTDDALLKHVVAVMAAHLRSFDLIIRLGDEEFLCAISDMTANDVRERFRQISTALAGAPAAGRIRTSFAELAADETAANLVARVQATIDRRAARILAPCRGGGVTR